MDVCVILFLANVCIHPILSLRLAVALGTPLGSAYVSVAKASTTSAFTLVFIVAVRSPAVGAFVKFVTVGIVTPVCVA